ncbi:MAG: hypothetical protein IPN29_06970 [Saprospiraceae bacterium]|nr:hypothetical protein [Saprospiraceae bacterium]
MEFKVFFYDPAKPEAIQLGEMNEASVMAAYESIDWDDLFTQLKNIKIDEIYHHPSFEVVHQKSKTSVLISAVEEAGVYVFNLIWVRPKKEKYFFGLFDKEVDGYLTSIKSRTKNDAKTCVEAFLRSDTETLECLMGQ